MKLGITKQTLPSLVERSFTYLGGMIVGIGLGMFVAVELVPEDDRQIFHFHYFVIAWVCVCIGPLVAILFRWKTARKESDDTQTVA